jgi:hypothetical protein
MTVVDDYYDHFMVGGIEYEVRIRFYDDGNLDVITQPGPSGMIVTINQAEAEDLTDQICEKRGLARAPVYLGVGDTSAHCLTWKITTMDVMRESTR